VPGLLGDGLSTSGVGRGGKAWVPVLAGR
jgi:hypothetical protein